ncbi:hypothetical protein DFJ74DRAFT_713777 [Hyaloraphidium curvatum]|nr:hypothetical protein DFJ74DRAFT_713777 [Hyaloraphidium curvatum]
MDARKWNPLQGFFARFFADDKVPFVKRLIVNYRDTHTDLGSVSDLIPALPILEECPLALRPRVPADRSRPRMASWIDGLQHLGPLSSSTLRKPDVFEGDDARWLLERIRDVASEGADALANLLRYPMANPERVELACAASDGLLDLLVPKQSLQTIVLGSASSRLFLRPLPLSLSFIKITGSLKLHLQTGEEREAAFVTLRGLARLKALLVARLDRDNRWDWDGGAEFRMWEGLQLPGVFVRTDYRDSRPVLD